MTGTLAAAVATAPDYSNTEKCGQPAGGPRILKVGLSMALRPSLCDTAFWRMRSPSGS